MNTDLDELKGLVTAIKADHHAQKEKEKRERWTKYVSLSTIIIAVLAAVATQRGAGYSSANMKQLNEATFNQTQASDQWAFFQAKGIKQSLCEEERDRLANANPTNPKALAAIEAKLARYEKERKEITAIAKSFEAKRDAAREASVSAAAASRKMGLVTSIFQISIALGGMTLVVKKRWLWFASLLGGALALAEMAKVFVS